MTAQYITTALKSIHLSKAEYDELVTTARTRLRETMSDVQITQPLADGFVLGYSMIAGTEVVPLRYADPDLIARYCVFETPGEVLREAREREIRRKASLVRKRILKEEGFEEYEPGPQDLVYTASFKRGEWAPLCGRHDGVIPWYVFPSSATRDRFFRLMGPELKDLV